MSPYRTRRTYGDKLKDPRWQKRRLEILQRDKWTCQQCEATDETLHVHHLWYKPDTDPWEAPDRALLTLCETCHEDETACWPDEADMVVRALREGGFMSLDLNYLMDGFANIACKPDEYAYLSRRAISMALSIVLRDPRLLEQVIALARENHSALARLLCPQGTGPEA